MVVEALRPIKISAIVFQVKNLSYIWLGLAIIIGGFLIGRGFEKGRSKDRFVTVKGVVLSGWEEPQYHFSDLAAIKPKMIEKATVDARGAAKKFADDA